MNARVPSHSLKRSLDSSCMINKERAQELLQALEEEDRDLFFYSGDISQSNPNRFIVTTLLEAQGRARKNVSLVLSTHGGDAHSAYRLARLIQDRYGSNGRFRLVVLGPCKSAGTLVAVGAGELAMSLFGELGPLDVQLRKHDEIAGWTSGLDTLGALAMLQSEAFNAFEHYLTAIVGRSGYTVSTKTACDVSGTLVSGLFQPIASQIDPHRLSEVDRSMKIAQEYGNRLGGPNLKEGESGRSLKRLISGYPTHDFIIDTKEAREIFETVLPPSVPEMTVVELFSNLVLYPESRVWTVDVTKTLESIADPDKATETPATPSNSPDGGGVDGVGDSERDGEETAS